MSVCSHGQPTCPDSPWYQWHQGSSQSQPWYHDSSFLPKVLLVLLSRYVAFGELRTLPALSETCSPRHFLLALCVSWAHAISAQVCVMTSYSKHLCGGLSLASELFSPEMLVSECVQEQPPANGVALRPAL